MLRRLFVVPVAALSVAGVAPRTASATTPVHVVSTWPALLRVFAAGGPVRLAADIESPAFSTLPVGATPVVLDLRGFSLHIRPTKGKAGIEVGPAESLRIMDTSGGLGGLLLASGGTGAAGIGGDDGEDAGSITVSGGRVWGIGAAGGAGLGGGNGGAAGQVRVTGGSVNGAAFGSESEPAGAGIGSGAVDEGHDPGVTGALTATGGAVTGTSDHGGAGIGGGAGASGMSVRIGEAAVVGVRSGFDGASAVGAGVGGSDFGTLTNAGALTIDSSRLVVPTGATVRNSGTIHPDDGTFHLAGGGVIRNSGDIAALVDGDGSGPVGVQPLVINHSYQVTFDGNDGSDPYPPIGLLAATIAQSGWNIAPPAAPPGSAFAGWFTAPVGGTRVTTTTDLPSLFGRGPVPVTLYAQYDRSVPSVTSLSPVTGPVAGGQTVIVTGTGFAHADGVSFGVTDAQFHVDSDTQLTVVSPAHRAGRVFVHVHDALGDSAEDSEAQYRFT